MSKFVTSCSWWDVPHFTEEERQRMWNALPPYAREARGKGKPGRGAGVIYPVSESIFIQDPFRIPNHYQRAYGLDVGWNVTAAIFGAYSDEEDTWYIYSEYVGEKMEPAINASAIRARSQGWIRGVIDPASMGASQSSGHTLLDMYTKNGLDLEIANNAVEPGILEVYQRLSEKRLVIFSTCVKTLQEIRLYHRSSKGKIIKKDDHLMDAMRYLIMTGEGVMRVEPMYDEEQEAIAMSHAGTGRNSTTGY